MRDTALYAHNARQKVKNAALGEPNVWIAHARGVVLATKAVALLHRLP
jgi:hypothetical protein